MLKFCSLVSLAESVFAAAAAAAVVAAAVVVVTFVAVVAVLACCPLPAATLCVCVLHVVAFAAPPTIFPSPRPAPSLLLQRSSSSKRAANACLRLAYLSATAVSV